jgi:hypothetical protein
MMYLDVAGRKYQEAVSNRPPLWRVKHWKEAGRTIPSARPEVWPLFPNHFVPFTKPWQLTSKEMNPKISARKWTVFYGGGLIIANQQGFGMRKPRANFVTGENIDAELPRVELLDCGGNVLTGHVEGLDLVVDVLDWRSTPPSAEALLAQPWHCMYAVMVYGNGGVGYFPQGEQPDGSFVPVVHPLLGDPTQFPKITIPLSCVEKWDRPGLPDPYHPQS